MALIGIPTTEVKKKTDRSPNLHFGEPLTMFAEGGTIATNIAFRAKATFDTVRRGYADAYEASDIPSFFTFGSGSNLEFRHCGFF
jgi:hypothetical protein